MRHYCTDLKVLLIQKLYNAVIERMLRHNTSWAWKLNNEKNKINRKFNIFFSSFYLTKYISSLLHYFLNSVIYEIRSIWLRIVLLLVLFYMQPLDTLSVPSIWKPNVSLLWRDQCCLKFNLIGMIRSSPNWVDVLLHKL